MKILMINKFLHPNGGSETYIFKLGDVLRKHGHEVQYFGMEHEGRCVGNAVNAYTSDMDFHGGSRLSKLSYPIKTIYSAEARKKIRLVLDDFQPDVCHLNNFNYQLTPSVILEIRRWEKESGRKVKIVATIHDLQLICPNHQMKNPRSGAICEKCINQKFYECLFNRCIHDSFVKSLIGCIEAYFWRIKRIYRQIDSMICPTRFMKEKMDTNSLFAAKTVVIQNFIDSESREYIPSSNYVLYFGRFSREKGIKTLVSVCQELPQIKFVFAGSGPLESEVNAVENIENVGFQTGHALEILIQKALFSVCPSEVYENCPFSVMESQMYGTPVLGANIGGIPELIEDGRTGELFESGDRDGLKEKIQRLWEDQSRIDMYSQNCRKVHFDTAEQYYEKIMEIYKE